MQNPKYLELYGNQYHFRACGLQLKRIYKEIYNLKKKAVKIKSIWIKYWTQEAKRKQKNSLNKQKKRKIDIRTKETIKTSLIE